MDNIPQINYNPIFRGNATTMPTMPQLQYATTPQYSTAGSTSSLGSLAGFITNPVGQALGSLAGGLINNFAEDMRARQQRQWNEKMYQMQKQDTLDMWNMTNEYNSPKKQLERLQDAGLNALYFGLDGSSANQANIPQAMGYDRASNPNGIANPLAAGLDAVLAKKQLEATDAQINKTKGETDSITLDNEFAKKTFNARAEGIELSNRLTKEQINKIIDERSKIAAEIKKIAAETENEYEKKILMQCQERLLDAQANEIVQLLPFKQLLLQAETSAQRAQAALSSAQAAIQNGLIEKGYIDTLFNQAEEELNLKKKQVATEEQRRQFTEAQRKLNEFRNNVYNGQVFDENTWNEANSFERGIMGAFNGLFNTMSIITTAIGAPFTKILGM